MKKITDRARLNWLQKNYADLLSDRFSNDEKFLINRPQTQEEQSRMPWKDMLDFGWHKTIR